MAKFTKNLSTLNLTAIFTLLIFGSYGAAQMTGGGRTSITMFMLAVVTFLIPASLIVYELGTVIPTQSGAYQRVKESFGKLHGFVSGWLSWLPILLTMPLNATALVKHVEYIFDMSFSNKEVLIGQIILVLFSAAISILHINKSKKLINILFFISIGTAIIAFGYAVMSGGDIGVNGLTLESLKPNFSEYGFIYSAAILWLLGVEDPFNMGGEVKDIKKTAKTMLTWGNLVLVLGYLFGMIAILLLVKATNIDPILGLVQSLGTKSILVSKIVASFIVLAISGSLISYFTSYSRLLVTFGEEEILPGVLSKQDKNEIPYAAIVAQIIACCVVMVIFSYIETNSAFNLYVAALVVVRAFSLYYIYLALPIVRYKFAHLYNANTGKIPGNKIIMRIVVGVALIFNTVSIFYVFKSSWVPEMSVESWRLRLGVISGLVILSSVLIYYTSYLRYRK